MPRYPHWNWEISSMSMRQLSQLDRCLRNKNSNHPCIYKRGHLRPKLLMNPQVLNITKWVKATIVHAALPPSGGGPGWKTESCVRIRDSVRDRKLVGCLSLVVSMSFAAWADVIEAVFEEGNLASSVSALFVMLEILLSCLRRSRPWSHLFKKLLSLWSILTWKIKWKQSWTTWIKVPRWLHVRGLVWRHRGQR